VGIFGVIFTTTAGFVRFWRLEGSKQEAREEGPVVHIGACISNFIAHVPWLYWRIIGVHATRRVQAVFLFAHRQPTSSKVDMRAAELRPAGRRRSAQRQTPQLRGCSIWLLEEVASHWPTWLTVQVFACTLFAAPTTQCLAYGINQVSDAAIPALSLAPPQARPS
jgi:hypothetical protein